MEWLEIIELRSTILDNKRIKKQLAVMLEEITTDQKERRIRLFCNDSIETDFIFHIEHFSGPPKAGSKLGLHISMVLKKLGLINHKIWTKIENAKNGKK